MHRTIFILLVLLNSAMAENAMAYCWRNTLSNYSVHYACFGPDQKSQSYYDSLEDALFACGCEMAESNENQIRQEGIKQGVWFDCQVVLGFGMHTPNEIKTWLKSKQFTN